jgi:hypothetical protein
VGLTKGLRNDIFRAVEGAGLSPGEFQWDNDESTLRHVPSGAYFAVGGVAGDYHSRYLAGDGPVEERTGISRFGLMHQVGFWLTTVKLDVETPDLWAQLQRDAGLLGAVSDEAIENTPFTYAEKEEIAERLRELGDHIRLTYSLNASQTQLLNERLGYLANALNRVGRKDWLLMFGGVILTYVLGAALPQEAARDAFETLLTSSRHVLGGGPFGLR